jgi:two-component system chemotaxis sensor kinase CheA
MEMPSGEFQQRLLATFNTEARDHLNAIASGLIALEQASPAVSQAEIVETIFRETHRLKGAARAVNLTAIETVCQAVEDVFAALQRQEIGVLTPVLDVLHTAVSMLGDLLDGPETPPDAPYRARVSTLVHSLERVAQGGLPPALQGEERSATEATERFTLSEPEDALAWSDGGLATEETLRVSSARLALMLLQAEALLTVKWTTRQRVAKLQEVQATLSAWLKTWSKLRHDVRVVRRLYDMDAVCQEPGSGQPSLRRLLEFVDWSQAALQPLDAEVAALRRAVEYEQDAFGTIVEQLHEETKQVLMIPFSTLLAGFPPFVRRVSRAQGKDVELVMHGGAVEVDRRVLEGIKDPLVHLVCNCIDHGLEMPLERERRHKPRRGRITITIEQKDARSVELRIADDGVGVDTAAVKAAVVRLGLLSAAEAAGLSTPEVLPLVFQSGVSASPIITDISGRGLGLSIVREKVEQLAGTISMDTQADVGTTFSMVLPITLATLRGLIVRMHEHLFVLPTVYVERVERVHAGRIKTVENRETIALNGYALALVRLAETLELPRQHTPSPIAASIPAVVLAAAARRVAFLVDEVLEEQEILAKSLGQQLSRVRNVAGVTVLSTGDVVPILHVPDLMLSAARARAARLRAAVAATETSAAPRHAVLVAENSITARMLLKNILEAAGYEVETAADGLEACTRLTQRTFAAVVSDVDMPGMNGFDLTAKIRRERRLAAVPVVLVTALDSSADRERGLAVGANAYIVKGSFDQSHLLDVLRRLL